MPSQGKPENAFESLHQQVKRSLFGLSHPIGESLFAMEADENRVYLIPKTFKRTLTMISTYWRDKKLLTLGAHEVESFQLDDLKPTSLPERKKANGFCTLVKEEMAGDIENIDSFLSAAAFLSATKLISDDKSDAKARVL